MDDTGRRFGPVTFSIGARQARNFNSTDLERGNASRGMTGGVGNGTGMWRLTLKTPLTIDALAYIRTPDGLVTSMPQVASASPDNELRYYVPFFNPARNTNSRSWASSNQPQFHQSRRNGDGTGRRWPPARAGGHVLLVPESRKMDLRSNARSRGGGHHGKLRER